MGLDERPDRGHERVPVRSRKVGAPDRAREEDVAGEEAPVRVVRDVSRRMPGHGEDVEFDTGKGDRLPSHGPHHGP